MFNSPDKDRITVKKRFERDAHRFDAIYNENKNEWKTWFNRTFRKPIFERYEIAFQIMGNLKNKTVLDVGCGSGVYCIQCALKGAARVKGVDFSQPMLALAEKRANEHNVINICEFELKDFLETNFEEKFDFTLAMGVFDYLSDPIIFLRKLKRVTRNKIIASFPGHSLLREPLRKIRYFFSGKGPVFFYSDAEIRNLIQEIQFHDIEILPLQMGSGFILIAHIGA